MKKKSRKRVIILIVALVVVAIIVFVVLNNQNASQASYTQEQVKSQDISTYLTFSGHIRASDTKQQVAKKSMKVKDIYVEEGDSVEEGALLFKASDGERVYAEISGVIEVLYVEEDISLSPGSPIADIVNYGDLMVKVDADEYDVGALTTGQGVDIFVNALGRMVGGTIDKISNDATVGKDVSYYTVEILLSEQDGLRAGMSVEAQILDKHSAGATVISMNALQFDYENQPYVYIKDSSGNIVAQYVGVGINDGSNVEIISGLQTGDTVYRPSSSGMLMPGMMMRG